MFFDSACSCLRTIYWSQVFSGEWRCSWSGANRRCSNYIWVINNFIPYSSVPYIRDLTVNGMLGFRPLLESLQSFLLVFLIQIIQIRKEKWTKFCMSNFTFQINTKVWSRHLDLHIFIAVNSMDKISLPWTLFHLSCFHGYCQVSNINCTLVGNKIVHH